MSDQLHTQIKEKVNEISLILVMSSPNEPQGMMMVVDMCTDLKSIAAQDSKQYERLIAATKHIETNKSSSSLYQILQDFVGAATKYMEGNTEVKFPHEISVSAVGTPSKEVSGEIDPQFLKEYIETHTLMLEEFEASLLECRNNPEKANDLDTSVKRYLHNLKGDSGSIGLMGIEKVCHTIEDMLTQSKASQLIQHLLNFKEWVTQCTKSYAKNETQPKSSSAFLDEIKNLPISDESTVKVASSPAPTPSKIEKPSAAESHATEVPKDYALTGEPEILVEFVTEAEEHLGSVEGVVLDSEGNYSKDAIDTIFRCVHSLKGGSAYFNLIEMTKCSHILENYLTEVRDGQRTMDQALSGLMLTYIDLQKNVLTRAKKCTQSGAKMEYAPASASFLKQLEDYGRNALDTTTPQPAETTIVQTQAAAIAPPTPSANKSADSAESKEGKLDIKTFVKVDTTRLDHLIDSVGEMTIYSSMLIRFCRDLLADNPEVMDATHRVEKLARDLQDVGMSMRLVPIKSLFQKMARLAWDTSKKIGKDVNFIMEGEDTELDRNLIDKLSDPLMHMVRNSLDHGVETPEERIKKGKPRAGRVSLSAFHAGGSIHIKISDDGKGLNPDKLVAKAIEKGIITPEQKLSQNEIYQLIFAPGFSTAAAVTDLSGRGVGMDVVRRNVESLRGRIFIESKVDVGSTFTIELPLTLAIIDGIQIAVGKENFIIPSLSIVEFLKPTPEMISRTLDHAETLNFRGQYLPIFRLSSLYGIEPLYKDPLDASMIVVENNHELIAIMVDEILGECSTVIKSLGNMFEEGKGIAGCAIMPRGNVALILDILSLVQLARANYDFSAASVEQIPQQSVMH